MRAPCPSPCSGPRSALLALDLGTTAIRAGAFAIDGELLALDRARRRRRPSRLGATSTTRTRSGSRPRRDPCRREASRPGSPWPLAVASVGEAGLPVDAYGAALGAVISWYDERSGRDAELEAALGAAASTASRATPRPALRGLQAALAA